MHPTIIYIRNENNAAHAEVKTQLAFTPELNTTIYYNGVKARVALVVIDVTPAVPVIIIHAQIKTAQ